MALCCDPVINLWGAFWPAWVICMIAGISLAVASRYLFALVRIEPHLGPLVLVYPALTVLYACTIWLLFYRA